MKIIENTDIWLLQSDDDGIIFKDKEWGTAYIIEGEQHQINFMDAHLSLVAAYADPSSKMYNKDWNSVLWVLFYTHLSIEGTRKLR